MKRINYLHLIVAGLVLSLTASAQAGMSFSTDTYYDLNGNPISAPLGAKKTFTEVDQDWFSAVETTSFTVYLSAGQTFRGWGAYEFRDIIYPGEGYTDPGYAFVSVAKSSGGAALSEIKFWDLNWTSWSFTSTENASYQFTYGVSGDELKVRSGIFAEPVPEPSTWVAGLLGCLAFVPSLRSGLRRVLGAGGRSLLAR